MVSTVFTVRTPRSHDAVAIQNAIEKYLLEAFAEGEVNIQRHTRTELDEEKSDRELRREIVSQQARPDVTNAQLQRLYNWVKTGSFTEAEEK